MIKLDKDYKVKKVNKGITKNGKNYTIIKITDSKKGDDGNWVSNNYAIFVLDDIDVLENATVTIPKISGVDYKVREYNGKTYADCTLYADSVTILNPVTSEFADADPFGSDDIPF
jgi:hypothetical protein